MRQLMEWFYLYQEEPWGWDMEEFRQGQLCSVIVNSSGRVVKKEQPPSVFYARQPKGSVSRRKSGPPSMEELMCAAGV